MKTSMFSKNMRGSVETFGRRSRSQLTLQPITTVHNQINRIEINFNGFVTPVKSAVALMDNLQSVRSLSSAGKSNKIVINPSNRSNQRPASKSRPLTVEEVYVFRIRDRFIQKSQEHLQKASVAPVVVGLPEHFLKVTRSKKDIIYGKNFNRRQLMERRLRESRLRTQH